MVRPLRRVDTETLRAHGIAAIDSMLGAIGYAPTAKAASILSRAGYDRAVRELLRLIARTVHTPDTAALRSAAEQLDRDWPNLSPARRNKVIAAAAATFLRVPEIVVPKVSEVITEHAEAVIRQTRLDMQPHLGVRISPQLSAVDTRIAEYAGRSQAAYITDAYGNRAVAFEQKARDIVARGLDRGAGRDEIGEELSNGLVGAALGRSEAYWNMIAAVHTVRARSWGQLTSYQEAGIDSYAWKAVGDEATCDICDMLDGTVFDVGEAADRYEQVEQADDPQDVEDLQPWIRIGRTTDGGRFLFVEPDGQRHLVAQVDRSAAGEKDQRGEYSRRMPPHKMQKLGIGMAPAHGGCRCITVPA